MSVNLIALLDLAHMYTSNGAWDSMYAWDSLSFHTPTESRILLTMFIASTGYGDYLTRDQVAYEEVFSPQTEIDRKVKPLFDDLREWFLSMSNDEKVQLENALSWVASGFLGGQTVEVSVALDCVAILKHIGISTEALTEVVLRGIRNRQDTPDTPLLFGESE